MRPREPLFLYQQLWGCKSVPIDFFMSVLDTELNSGLVYQALDLRSYLPSPSKLFPIPPHLIRGWSLKDPKAYAGEESNYCDDI